MPGFIEYFSEYLVSAGLLIGALVVGSIFQFLVLKLIRVIARKTATILDDLMLKHLKAPFRFLGPVVFISIIFPYTTIPPDVLAVIQRITGTLFIIIMAWILIKIISIAEAYIETRFDRRIQGNLRARKIYTQMQIIKRVISVVILVIAIAVILLQFDEIRHLGTTILASAGVLGIIMGFAAQRSISTLFAGFQIALAQPIRIDDVVIVENEWGWIEEITLTYVVIRIWDLRRLVVPITYFIEKPFQNWTRTTSDLLGTVFLYTDYTVPVEKVREKLMQVVSANPLWDGKVCNLQVTNTGDKTMELRALMSASDSPRLWDLRCQVRESMIRFMQQEYPDSLPRVRAVLDKPELKK